MGSPTTIQPLSLFPYHYSPLVPVQPLAYTPSPVQSFTDYKMLPRRHQSSRADGSWSMNLFLGTMVFVMIMMFTGQMLYERELRRRLACSTCKKPDCKGCQATTKAAANKFNLAANEMPV